MSRHRRFAAGIATISFGLLLSACFHADAQSWGKRLKRIAEGAMKQEVENKVDEKSREVARCVTGDDDCIRSARQRGDEVEIVEAGAPEYAGHDESDAGSVDAYGVSADLLAAGLEQDGKVVLDGLQFDTGKATLQAGSDPSLEQAALLLQQQPSLKLLVVGHTDGAGDAAANLKLSQRRAEAVRKALLARGVAASRLAAQGVGSSVPVASNDTEDGRARNRRVELVKQ